MNKKIEKAKKAFSKILKTFDFSEIQTALSINRRLVKDGLTWDDYERLIGSIQKDPDIYPPLIEMPERIRRKLERARIDWNRFEKWVSFVWEENKISAVKEWGVRTCPECGGIDENKEKKYTMTLGLVNHHSGAIVGGRWKSQWHCNNPNCCYDIFSEETVEKELLENYS